METFVLLVAIVLLIVLLLGVESKRDRKLPGIPKSEPHKKEFFSRFSLFNESEKALFHELNRQLPRGYHVFPKMRVADILTTLHGHGYYSRRNKLLPRHIDFVIADPLFAPVVAIELNGGYHNSYRQKISDKIKIDVFQHAGLPLEVINVGERYRERVAEILAERITVPKDGEIFAKT